MANDLKRQGKRVLLNLRTLFNKVQEKTATVTEEQTLMAVKLARIVLKNTNHSQKFGDKLINEIGYIEQQQKNGVKFKIIAPYTNKTWEMKQHMFYAEYGAGVGTEFDLHKGRSWGYVSRPEDKTPELGDKKQSHNSTYSSGFKFKNKKGQLISIVKESQPAHYMREAENFLRRNLAAEISKEIHFEIINSGFMRSRMQWVKPRGK